MDQSARAVSFIRGVSFESLTGPGVSALGSIRHANFYEFLIGHGIEMMVDPPLGIPDDMVEEEIDLTPGGVYRFNSQSGKMPMEYRSSIRVAEAHAKVQEYQHRIRQFFFYDIMLALLSTSAQKYRTATEVNEVTYEKIQVLAGMVLKLHTEYLQSLILNTVYHLEEIEQVPPEQRLIATDTAAPIRVKYTSQLAARLEEYESDRALSLVNDLAMLDKIELDDPALGDVLDMELLKDKLARAKMIDSDLIRKRSERNKRKQERDKASADMQKMQMMQQLTKPIDLQQPVPTGSPMQAMLEQLGGQPV